MFRDLNIPNVPLLTKDEEQEITRRLGVLKEKGTIIEKEVKSYLKGGNELDLPEEKQVVKVIQYPPKIKREIDQIVDRLVRANQRLIISIAKKYLNRGLEIVDLVQEGNIGLMKAIDKFKPEKGFKFSTYAVWWIRHEITSAVANQSRTIRVPVHRIEDINKLMRAYKFLIQDLGRPPENHEIAKVMKVKIEEVEKILETITKPISLETPVGEDSTIMDFIPFEFDVVEDHLAVRALHSAVNKVLATLTPREEKVIRMRFGIGEEEFTLKEISEDFNITAERIRQIECAALKKLRHETRTKKLEDFS